ncbi:MAG: ABC transporter ATP-binding protein [Chloroflexota bacterium]
MVDVLAMQLRTQQTGEPVIVAEHLWKGYRRQTHQVSLRHETAKMAKSILHRGPAPAEPFWALKDVTFSIKAGESVAIVGRNGSGKTTLLRVLCQVTAPTRGYSSVRGRFATLIGLGAGFNLERTGRENIFLNAAIQGTSPREIEPRLNDIIEFSELGEFIETPVKRYSNGMITRLGFSIAAHILPDIIFVDEVLAVGDAAFQQKCMERIYELKAEGRTLMFVSHAADTVKKLCERAIWLHQGVLKADGPSDMVLAQYEAMLRGDTVEA